MTPSFPDIPEQDWVIEENDIEWSIDEESINWENDPHMDLPEGVKTYTVNENEAEQRSDFYIRFPEGYIEPEHVHDSAHAVLIIDGTMSLHGHTLTSGDYLYGQKTPHGPMEYSCDDADYGCLVFASFVGGSPSHDWDEDPNE
jgi:hypothetical protein